MSRALRFGVVLVLAAGGWRCSERTTFGAADYVGTWKGANAMFVAVTLQVTPVGTMLYDSLAFTVVSSGTHMAFSTPLPALITADSLVVSTGGDDGWVPCPTQTPSGGPTWFTASARPFVFAPGARALRLRLTIYSCGSYGVQHQSDVFVYPG